MLGKIHLVTSFHNQIDIHNRWAIESYTFFQLKVKNDSCSINADFASAIKVCFAPYDSSYEDTSEYIPDFRKYTSISASVDIYFRSKFWPIRIKALVTQAQFLDITIKRYYNNLTYFAMGFYWPTKVSS